MTNDLGTKVDTKQSQATGISSKPHTSHLSLMAQVLPEIEAELKDKKTSSGFTLSDVVRSGVENPDSGVGCYAPDAESYQVFAPFFDRIIKIYHSYDPAAQVHQRDLDRSKLNSLPALTDERIISTRIRCGRNLVGYPFAPGITREQRNEFRDKAVVALKTLEGDLAGAYYNLNEMSDEIREQMIKDHFLFKQGDRFLESAGANRDWPEGRGIFHNANKTALVWVNEEDQLRIISMQMGAGFLEVFDRFARLVEALEKQLEFVYDENRGYLGSCPTNIGTAMRASVHVALPKLGKSGRLEALGKEYGLSVRGIHGEHSETDERGVVDISNKRRIGVSEVEGVRLMYDGLVRLLQEEDKL
jgi:protein-arginine kinase